MEKHSGMDSFRILKRNFERSFKNRGLIETFGFATATIFSYIQDLTPSRRKAIALQKDAGLEFDDKYGVDTHGIIRLSALHVDGKNWVYGGKYEPIHFVDFGQLLEPLNIPYGQFLFVDFGSGKGRALLLAAALPFKKIIGIEFSDALTSIAKNNLFRYPKELKACKDIEFVVVDAAEYDLPYEPLVLYFFNPFKRPVMKQVVNNVTRTFQAYPRRIVVLYFSPYQAHLWDNIGFLEKVKDTCLFR